MRRRGFTLIELMIVVGIIALFTGLVLPFFVGRVQGGGSRSAAAPLVQAPPSVDAAGAVRQPITESSDFRVELEARQEIDGWKVGTRYRARVEATYVIRNQDGHELRLAFPFPTGMTEARSVSLALDKDGGWVEPVGVSYDLGAIRWTGAVKPGEAVKLRISYESEGRDAFVYDVAGSGCTGRVYAELLVRGVEQPKIPPSSLPPTTIADGRLEWSFQRLLTNERIRVELPPGPSPLGRLVLLCQLAALAVLLFGAGFWYLSELDGPGRLDTFRWGHFLLLAGNFSLFFAVFAFAGSVRWGLGLGACVSLPLLYVHVSRFVDERFARTRALPLAVVALLAVMVAVYLPPLRPALALALVALSAGFVTLSYRNFAAGRFNLRDQRRRAAEDRKLVLELERALAPAEEAQRVLEAALAAVPGASVERARAEAAWKDLSSWRAEGERLKSELEPRAVERAQQQLARSAHAAQAATTPLQRMATEARERSFRGAERPAHCLACGVGVPRGNRHCGACGAAQLEERACNRCGEVTRLPLHLLRKDALVPPLHCPGCGSGLS